MTAVAQRSFASGELSPDFYPQCNVQKYLTALKACRNMVIRRQGGAESRAGTTFDAEVYFSATPVRLIPFIFDTDAGQAYCLEFGNNYVRFHLNGSQVLEATQNVTGITNSNPAIVTCPTHGYNNGDEVVFSGISDPNMYGRNFLVANSTTNTFSLQYKDGSAVNSTHFTLPGSGITVARVYTVSTPYSSSEVSQLDYEQSADVMYLTHQNHPIQTLSREGGTQPDWALSAFVVGPVQQPPTGLDFTHANGSQTLTYQVTAVNQITQEESLPISITHSNVADVTSQAHVLTWQHIVGASYYNIYGSENGSGGFPGFMGIANDTGSGTQTYSVTSTPLLNGNIDPDFTHTAPIANNPFSGAGNYPAHVGFIQQKLCFSNTINNPQSTWMSRTGLFTNFCFSTPSQDDDMVEFAIAGSQVNGARHVLEVRAPLILSELVEFILGGNQNGAITPSAVFPQRQSAFGCANIKPLKLEDVVLFVQARGTAIRYLAYDLVINGYRGDDLTIYSNHLFDGFTIIDWQYSQIPGYNVWAVRSDGLLLCLTYIRSQQMVAWSRHDFYGGKVENVCVIPEGGQDVLYVCVNRTINSEIKRYIERLSSRLVPATGVLDMITMDSAISFDGRNTSATTMTLRGSAWTYLTDLTLTASGNFFTASMVGDEIFLYDSTGAVIRAMIKSYTSATQVTVRANRTVPSTLQGIAAASWSHAVQTISGLWSLEGQNVSVMGDGFVVGSPLNNTVANVYTVNGGQIELDKCYAVIRVGLPMINDAETLDMDNPSGEPLIDKQKNVEQVIAYCKDSRGFFTGGRNPDTDSLNVTHDPLFRLTPAKIRKWSVGADSPIPLTTKSDYTNITCGWDSYGRVFIRNVDPIPLTLTAIVPAGMIPAANQTTHP